MRRTLLYRLIALVVAVLGSLSAPAVALAHGHAHEHVASAHEGDAPREHLGEHDAEHAPPTHAFAPGEPSVEGASSGDHAHGHPVIDLGSRAHDLRLSSVPVSVAIVAAPRVIRATLHEVRAPARTDLVLLARPGPERGPPPTLRAPPIR